jgi:HEAT repeat protein
MTDVSKVQAIMVELRDTNKDKRRTAVMKLGMLGGDEAIRALILTVENEFEDLIVRGRAAMLLGKMGDNRAVEPLIRALDAPGYQTPLHAAEALGRLGDDRAVQPLIIVADTNGDRLHNVAVRSLEQLGHDYDTDTFSPADDSTDTRSTDNTADESAEAQAEHM